MMCIGNTVKSTADYETSCPTTCDGLTKVPNSGHTACGKSRNDLTTSHDEIARANYIFIYIAL